MDDILISTRKQDGIEFHEKILRMVLEDLTRANVLISAPKLAIFQDHINFLGHHVNQEGISILAERKEYFATLNVPSTRKGLGRFLGISNYVSPFIRNYHVVAKSLYGLLDAKKVFSMGPEHIAAVKEICALVDKAPNLALLMPFEPIFMISDASATGCGCIFIQVIEGQLAVLRYWSYAWPESMRRLHSSLLEVNGILLGVASNPYLTCGIPRKLIIINDCFSLIKVLSKSHSSGSATLARYALKLSGLLCHVKCYWTRSTSRHIKMADLLSRGKFLMEESFATSGSDPDRVHHVVPDEWAESGKLLSIGEIFNHAKTLNFEDELLRETAPKVPKTKELIEDLVDGLGPSRKAEAEIQAISARGVESWDPCTALLHGHDVPRIEGIRTDSLSSEASTLIIDTLSLLNKDLQEIKNLESGVKNIHNLTPEFIHEDQQTDETYKEIFRMLLTTPSSELSKKVRKNYALFNNYLLVTRKDKKLDFSDPGNLRIVLPYKSAIIALATMHLVGHVGINILMTRVRSQFYIKSMHPLARAVCLSCCSCRMNKQNLHRDIPEGICCKAKSFREYWQIDYFFMKDAHWKHRTLKGVLNIVDQFTKFSFAVMISSTKHEEALEILRTLFLKFGPPKYLASDRQTSLVPHKNIRALLYAFQVTPVSFISYRAKAHSMIENHNKILRNLLKSNSHLLRKPWPAIFDETLFQANMTVRKYATAREEGKRSKMFYSSPMQMVFGVSDFSFDKFCSSQMSEQQQTKLKEIQCAIIKRHHENLVQTQKQRVADYRASHKAQFVVDDLVLLKRFPEDKHHATYHPNIYRIVERKNSLAILLPLYGRLGFIDAHISFLKPLYNSPELVAALPQVLRKYFTAFSEEVLSTKSEPPPELGSYVRPQRKMKTRNAQRIEAESLLGQAQFDALSSEKSDGPLPNLALLDPDSSGGSSDESQSSALEPPAPPQSEAGDSPSRNSIRSLSTSPGIEEGISKNDTPPMNPGDEATPPKVATPMIKEIPKKQLPSLVKMTTRADAQRQRQRQDHDNLRTSTPVAQVRQQQVNPTPPDPVAQVRQHSVVSSMPDAMKIHSPAKIQMQVRGKKRVDTPVWVAADRTPAGRRRPPPGPSPERVNFKLAKQQRRLLPPKWVVPEVTPVRPPLPDLELDLDEYATPPTSPTLPDTSESNECCTSWN